MVSLFPRDVLDEIWYLIESVSEGFFNYFYKFVGDIFRSIHVSLDDFVGFYVSHTH